MAGELAPRAQALSPPSERYTLIGWAQKHLFNTWYDSLLTILIIVLGYAILRAGINWVFRQADWEVIGVNLRLLMTGQYPSNQAWRIWLCLHLLAGITGLSFGIWGRIRWQPAALLLLALLSLAFLPGFGLSVRLQLVALLIVAFIAFGIGRLGGLSLGRIAIVAWLLYFPLVILIIRGFTPQEGWFPIESTNLWGGLLLTFLLTIVGITVSFPVGVLLALGRRSTLPAVRLVCVVYIEVIRGVPLVTILFMASNMVPFFLPSGITIDRVLRAMVGIVLFSAAYLAENVRGGLQAIPRGQYEAAYALGLGGFKTTALIVLPQALRIVIPPIMGQFISLYKDTSLVTIIGLLDLLGISRSILAQPQFIGRQHEVFLFITMIYWSFSYFMSYASQRLEIALGLGRR